MPDGRKGVGFPWICFPALLLAHCGTFCVSASAAIPKELVALSLPFIMCKTSLDGRYDMHEGLGTHIPSLSFTNAESGWNRDTVCAQANLLASLHLSFPSCEICEIEMTALLSYTGAL